MVDILAIGAHPDDIELSCSATLAKHIAQGYSVGLLDLCKGEMGTRGTVETRMEEAEKARLLMGAQFRWNAELNDGFLHPEPESNKKVAAFIRKSRPKLILANAPTDRHPDHGRAAQIVKEAFFLAGLRALKLSVDGKELDNWRPKLLLHYIQDYHLVPDIVVDVTEFMDKKIQLIKTFKSQFFDPDSTEPVTPISTRDFMEQMEGKARTYGRYIGAAFGEGFISKRPIGCRELITLT